MRSVSSFLVAAVLGCAGMLVVTSEASAQRFRVGFGSPGYSGGWGSSYYGGWGSPGIYGRGWGVSFGTPRYYGYSPYYSRSYWPSYSYGRSYYSTPSYSYYSTPSYSYGYSMPYSYGTTYSSGPVYSGSTTYSSGPVYSMSAYQPTTTTTLQGARIHAILPDPNAEVWFDEHRSTLAGPSREFVFSDETAEGQNFKHKVKVSWMKDGEMVTRERDIQVEGGGIAVVDFRKADASDRNNERAAPRRDNERAAPPRDNERERNAPRPPREENP
jgi:uncharacterized protein (TIGR03000 family)